MFLLNLGYRWSLPAAMDGLRGLVVLPAHNNIAKLATPPRHDCSVLLLDPQLYLAGLDVGSSSKVCARLASFPWCQLSGLPEYDATSMGQREWERELLSAVQGAWTGDVPADIPRACRDAIEYQVHFGVSHILLPSPLIREREDEAQTQAEWLDAGLAACEEVEVLRPILATVAVDEAVLNDDAFSSAGFVDAIVDQTTSRDGLAGVYIVVARTRAEHPFKDDQLVLRAYLTLARDFAAHGYESVVTNFADLLGLVCMGLGATAFASGPSQALRRLSLAGMQDEGGGTALPCYYSHRMIGEFLSESDLDRIVEKRLLRRVRDITPHSRPLLDVLATGGSASSLPSWAESKNNLAAAQRHLTWRLAEEGRGLSALASADERLDAVSEWLDGAAANVLLLNRRFSGGDVPGKLAPSETWLDLLDKAVGP